MKVTVVPAQVTTVEDRIAGSLGLSQLLLLAAPVFGGSALYIVLPPSMHASAYKLIIIGVLFLVGSLLAIRIKGKILLFWLVVILRYNLRPRYYLFNKNEASSRDLVDNKPTEAVETEADSQPRKAPRLTPLPMPEVVRLQSLMENPAARLSFKTMKGGLHVSITEVKD